MNETKDIVQQLEKPVDVKLLIDKLSFDADDFDQANLEQPKLRLEAGRYRTWAVLEKARSEFRVEIVEAELGIELRDGKEEKKLTEKAIQQNVVVSKDYRQARRMAYLAKATEEWAKQLTEAYDQRLMVLNNIVKIRTGEMASNLRSVKEKAAVDVMMKKAERLRRNLDE